MDIKSMLGLNSFSFGISQTSITYTIYFLIFALILGIVIFSMHQKKTYRYKVRIFRTRENGKVKEINCKAGYINRSTGAPFFRIKTGLFNSIDLTETPKLQYMDEEDRVYYNQIDVNTFIQVKRVLSGDTLTLTPVESDVKYGSILSVQRIRDVLNTEPTWKKVLPYAGLVVLAIVFIVSYYMLMDKCGA